MSMDSHVNPWKTKSSKIVYENPWICVREDQVTRPDGSPGIYGVVHTPGSVFVVALTDKEEILLVGQFRYPTGRYSLEIPAGSSDGQPLLESAQRELKEETGYEAEHWDRVGTFEPINGICDEVTTVFLARGLRQTGSHKMGEEGIDAVTAVPFEKVMDMIKTGQIQDGQTITAVVKTGLFLGKLK